MRKILSVVTVILLGVGASFADDLVEIKGRIYEDVNRNGQ